MNHAGVWKRGETVRVRLAVVVGSADVVTGATAAVQGHDQDEPTPVAIERSGNGWLITVSDELTAVLPIGRCTLEARLAMGDDVYITDGLSFNLERSLANG